MLSISEVLTALKKVKVFILVVGATVKDMDKVDKKIIKHFTNIKLGKSFIYLLQIVLI